MNVDTVALTAASRLLDCLCAQLALTVGGPTCQCCITTGAAPVDCCECTSTGSSGQAWVRVVRIYPSMGRFPLQSVDLTRCGNSGLAIELELGAYRCSSQVTEDGSPPTCAAMLADAAVVLDDAAAMRRAVACCFNDADTTLVMGQWQSYGPEGGCLGGTMTVTVQAYDRFPPALPPVE